VGNCRAQVSQGDVMLVAQLRVTNTAEGKEIKIYARNIVI